MDIFRFLLSIAKLQEILIALKWRLEKIIGVESVRYDMGVVQTSNEQCLYHSVGLEIDLAAPSRLPGISIGATITIILHKNNITLLNEIVYSENEIRNEVLHSQEIEYTSIEQLSILLEGVTMEFVVVLWNLVNEKVGKK
ncbi:MAG TPA: hypothetical protein VHS96_06210 [Bacteroidia bacterium]|nr:hypothetical protein [Bacteroidia bacterium]